MKKHKMIIIATICIVVLTLVILAIHNLKKGSNNPGTIEEELNLQVPSRKEKLKNSVIGGEKAVGWILIPGTDIDYPIYLETNEVITSKEPALWTRNIDINSINRRTVYGHNVRNVSSKPLINESGHINFEQLMSYTDFDFTQEHLYLQLTTKETEALYKIFAVSFYGTIEEIGGFYSTTDGVNEYIENATENSLYKFNIPVNETDDIISLLTCTRFFGTAEKTQFRVDARKVRSDEKITKYIVETTENYDIIK